MHLDAVRKHAPAALAAGAGIRGNVLIDATAVVAEGCLLGPDVVIGPGCVVEAGARLERCTIFAGTRVQTHAYVSGSIVGWKSVIGETGVVHECLVQCHAHSSAPCRVATVRAALQDIPLPLDALAAAAQGSGRTWRAVACWAKT